MIKYTIINRKPFLHIRVIILEIFIHLYIFAVYGKLPGVGLKCVV